MWGERRMLGLRKKTWLLIAINAFPDAIAIAAVGVAMEILYRLFSYFGLLGRGLEFFPLLGCFAAAVVVFLVRLPTVIRLAKAKVERREGD